MQTGEITLKNGATVPAAAVSTTMLSLRALMDLGMDGALALADLTGLAADPSYDASWSRDLLVKYGLLRDDGRMHDIVRNVVRSAVTGGELDLRLGSPVAEG